MVKRTSASRLRQDIYRILDDVASTGAAVEILRKGELLKIVREPKSRKLDRLTPHRGLKCDPESIVHLDWSAEWKP